MPRSLTVEEVIQIHAGILVREGIQTFPVRDVGSLASALARPEYAAIYDEADLIHQAVLLAISISQTQAFVDGNKRAALPVMHVFLGLNGPHCRSEPLPLAYRLEAVAVADPIA